jgi:ribonuclease HI
MAAKKKFYAVAVGKTRGIFTQWFGPSGAEIQVRGYPGALYKGFANRQEAEAFLENNPAKTARHSAAGKINGKTRRKTSKSNTDRNSGRALPAAPKGHIIIYTDGGSINNPGPGGYGAVIINGSTRQELSKGYRLTTNNRMELLACIAGLSAVEKRAAIVLYSDSQYVVNGMTKGWAEKWRANGWMRTKTEPARNADLWKRMLQLCAKHDVQFKWVKGHAGIAGNERCDELATQAANGINLAVDRVYEKSIQ